jgi:cytochrome c oxidase assembly protein subunit 15
MSLVPTTITARRTPGHKPALAWFAAFGGAWVFVLVLLGAFTTSIGAGMIFPDWPLSNGSLNPDGWLSDLAKFAEHSHRLSAEVMSLVAIGLAVWIWFTEERAWLRRLAIFAVVLVLVQAVVGGLRVLLEPEQVVTISTSVGQLFAMLHACLAQIFVCTLLAIAVSLSRAWTAPVPEAGRRVEWESPASRVLQGAPATQTGAGLRRLGRVCCGLLLVQLAVAAVMRHSFAGLAIPTFPLSTPDGALLPTAWDFRVAIQFAHRVMAALLAVALPWFAIALWRERVRGSGQKNGALLLVALLALQIFLGAEAVWRLRDPYWTTAHVLAGACLLATTFGLTWWTHRGVIESRAGAARRVGEPFASPRAGLAPDLGQKQTPTSNGALGTRPSREASTFAKVTADRPAGTATRPTCDHS